MNKVEKTIRPFSSVQLLRCIRLSATPWTAACQASLSITNSWSLLKLMSIESVRPSNHLILCRPLLLLPSIFPNIRVFSNESLLCIRWPKYWSFSFNISPSNEHLGLISFRIDWLDLLAVQGTLKSLLQHHSSKSSILQRSAFFMLQLSHPYMTTGCDYWRRHSVSPLSQPNSPHFGLCLLGKAASCLELVTEGLGLPQDSPAEPSPGRAELGSPTKTGSTVEPRGVLGRHCNTARGVHVPERSRGAP